MVKFITNISLHESIQLPGEPPLNGPGAIDMWLDAAEGDSAGMALVSLLAPFILPEAFEWGHFLAMGGSAPDFNDPDRDYKTELTPNTIIGSPLSLFIWGIARGWPSTDDQSIGEVPESDVETLLISGTLDGSTPMQHARDELMPHLSNGHQVFIEGQAHTQTFWHSQPQARAQLLNTFFDRGEVDESRYEYQAPVFDVETSWGSLARIAMAVAVLVFGLALALIVVIARKLIRVFGSARGD
jgi:pimeloyl-ACP methyl ester carboxylesterase